jgi:threonine aldolase
MPGSVDQKRDRNLLMDARIDLTASRAPRPVAAVFTELAAASEALDIASLDVYGDFGKGANASWLRAFEGEVATLLGKEDAIFVPSGVMAQQIALCIHRGARQSFPPSFICHHTSHLLLHEAEGYATLLGLTPTVVLADESAVIQQPLSAEDVSRLISRDKPDACAAFAVLLELPHREIGGKCTSFHDIECIARLCRSAGAAFHMDGARLCIRRPVPC